mmetsp:Transcript_29678/g.45521  ORF Transcript_29678/g.45521 Transcript_29678/m.45521 type:complete len:80 (-) Transcript_29678:188-427(-)
METLQRLGIPKLFYMERYRWLKSLDTPTLSEVLLEVRGHFQLSTKGTLRAIHSIVVYISDIIVASFDLENVLLQIKIAS